jgi:putative DNA primase/helicase
MMAENENDPFGHVVPLEPTAKEVSEDAIATAFVNIHSKTMRYDHDAGRWFKWVDTHWQADRTDLALHYTRELARRMGDGKKGMGKASVAAGAERFARSDRRVAVTSDYWDNDPMILGTPGGIVDLRSGEIAQSDPERRITKVTACAPEKGAPERWLTFLNDATGSDGEVIDFLQKWCGYCLTGDTREHALLFVYGGGGNGKSVFINTITRLLGDYATTAAMETFTASKHSQHSTDVAMLKGARLVTSSETEEGRAWAEQRIKQMTGADPITARFMRQDNFTYTPQFKLMIVGNHAPVLNNVDEAMRRRFRIIPFDRKPEAPDRLLEDRLVEEWPRILNWMIEGCDEWLWHGLPRPAAMIEATNSYFASQDIFGQWIEDDCEVGGNVWHETAQLFESWARYAKSNGEEPGTSKRFAGNMQKRGFTASRMPGGTRVRIYKGVELKRRDVPGWN